jgi:hypothetical protein
MAKHFELASRELVEAIAGKTSFAEALFETLRSFLKIGLDGQV